MDLIVPFPFKIYTFKSEFSKKKKEESYLPIRICKLNYDFAGKTRSEWEPEVR